MVSTANLHPYTKEIEDKILKVLSSSEGNILEDASAVKVLGDSKILSDDISAKQKVADETEIKIDETRAKYRPVAKHVSLLFFCVADMVRRCRLTPPLGCSWVESTWCQRLHNQLKVHPFQSCGCRYVNLHPYNMANIGEMYQYSLQWFTSLFIRGITDSTKSDDIDIRLRNIIEHYTFFLYTMVCRSTFENDKLLFSFLITTRILMAEGKIAPDELRFFLTVRAVQVDSPIRLTLG